MGRGRPPKGLAHVDSLPGDKGSKERLKVILSTLTGDLEVKEACSRLTVSETRFHDLRRLALEGMLEGLAPRPPGRPPKEEEPKKVRDLRREVEWLREELEISRLRTEIAMWKPSLLRDPAPSGEKRGSSPKRKGPRSRRRRPDGSDAT